MENREIRLIALHQLGKGVAAVARTLFRLSRICLKLGNLLQDWADRR